MIPEPSSSGPTTLDDLRPTNFHAKLALISAGGPFCDGYILGIVGIALPAIVRELHLTGGETGLVGAAALLGVLVGGMLGGTVSDRLGRRPLFTLNIAAFLVLSLLQGGCSSLPFLVGLRFLLGVAVGSDYPIATSYVTEFMPRKLRGPVLSGLILAWWGGYTTSYAVGYGLSFFPGVPWQVMLASSAVPSLILFCLRLGLPESPRWLIQNGRIEDARSILRDYLRTDIFPKAESQGPLSLLQIIQSPYRGTVVFVSAFWILQSAPGFAIHTLQAQLLRQYHVQNALLGSFCITGLTILGILPVTLGLINLIGRRLLLISTFAISMAGLLLLGISPYPNNWVIFLGFILYSVSEAAGSGLQFVYPNELFPTAIRASAVGMACSFSRLGAAFGTFLLPLGYDRLGLQSMMLIAAGFMLAGLLISYIWAPETKNSSLESPPSPCTS
ncbi:MFS transporter [Neokomagataea anthophila]|uniref:MFS transporter n=1 Tax=Neokomagataea anthophila TaxID=2826925 RepID=A0ABS5E7B1_9PROT|nr:MFS transporter [Neokomagataea anthophila]MBR0559792.1 MFS transporter [Neokomagataea anthophila]